MYALNQNYSLWPVSPLQVQQLIARMELGLIYQQMVYGVAPLREPILTWGSYNPHAPSNKNRSLQACYRKHELEKKRVYEQRIREIEHSTFIPSVLSATAGMGKEATFLNI